MFNPHILEPGELYTMITGGFSPVEIFIWYIKSYQHQNKLDNYKIVEQFNLQHTFLEHAFLTTTQLFSNNLIFQFPVSEDETNVMKANCELLKFTKHFFEEHQQVLDAIEQVKFKADTTLKK
jgi:hypothetical protein